MNASLRTCRRRRSMLSRSDAIDDAIPIRAKWSAGHVTPQRLRSKRAWMACAAGLFLGACATDPPVEYSVDIPAGVTDSRGRFGEIYCAVLEGHGHDLPDYRPCDAALSRVSPKPATSNLPVDLGSSRRRLLAAIVPGIGYGCFAAWLAPPGTAAAHVSKFGFGLVGIEVDALSGIEKNARQIRDAVMAVPMAAGAARIVLVGYSKGAPDILEAVVRYPEIHDRVAAVLSLSGAVGGSWLADDAEQWQAELLRHWPKADCDAGDGGGVASLRPEVRAAWLAKNPLPSNLRYYSLVTLPDPERVSRIVRSSYKKLGKIDWRNDSQVIYSDQIIPGSNLLGFLNADHWAVAVPLDRTHSIVGASMADKNDYPREALLEAVLRFIEEDLQNSSGR
jgi:hypothetical protein